MPTGRELVLAALRGETTERVPWVPFVGCHGGFLIETPADELLQSAENIVAGQLKAAELYQPDGLPVTFDLQIEAEALGCELRWEKNTPPAVSTHILRSAADHGLQVPDMRSGRIPIVMEAARNLRKELPDTALYGLITGPFTLAMHLLGSNLFMEMYDNPESLLELIHFCGEVSQAMAQGYLDAGCDVIAVVDPMTSQIGPSQFEEFVTPECTRLFDFIREQGCLSSFFVCGHALKNLEVMCDCRPDNVSVDENIPLATAKEICLERGTSFGGNLRLTTALLNGTPESNAINAFECLSVGGSSGFILAPGCDLPYSVPIANLQAVTDVVRDEYKRQVAEELAGQREDEDLATIDLSDYGLTDKVVVDIITLDSEACAPCQYMVEAVKEIVPQFEELVIWREHKIKSQDSVAFMASLMVKNVPTICIDGQIRFVSTIPTRDQLIDAIQDRINEKSKIKIKRRQARVTIVGDNGTDEELETRMRTAARELGLDLDIQRSADKDLARSYGAKDLPAVILSVSTLKSSGRMPEARIMKEWLKDLIL